MSEPENVLDIFLQPGELYFGEQDTRIRTILGSCVSITMWHPRHRIGGMCHYMLASGGRCDGSELNGKYGEDAVSMLFREAIRNKTNPRDYEFKIFGGGNMFPDSKNHWPCATRPCEEVIQGCRNVSCRNSNVGRAMLKHHRLNVVAEHLGGGGHRHLMFELWSGHAWVKQTPVSAAVG